MALAYTAYDLPRFSRGRFMLGLGSRVRAHITRRFSHTLMPPAFMPAPHGHGTPRVLIAGVGDAMTRVAGEVAGCPTRAAGRRWTG